MGLSLGDLVIPAIVGTGLIIVYEEYKQKKRTDVSREGQKMNGATDISGAFVDDSFWSSIKKTASGIFTREQGGADSPTIPETALDKMGDGLRNIGQYVQEVPLPVINNYSKDAELTPVELAGTHPVLGDLTGKTITKAEADILTSEKVVSFEGLTNAVKNGTFL